MAEHGRLILTIFSFYIVIGVLFGLIGSGFAASDSFETPEDPSILSALGSVAYFFAGIGFTISNIPLWANTIIFLPLGITIFYIGLDLLIPG